MKRGWAVLFGVVLFLELLLYVATKVVPGWGLPYLANAESFGTSIDRLYYVILTPVAFFFILTQAILVYCMWKYAGEDGRRVSYTHGNHKLEMAWTAVPALILLFIAFVQIGAWEEVKYQSQMKPPQHVIEVSARQFEWRFRYPEKSTRDAMTTASEADEKVWFDSKKAAADRWGRDANADFGDLRIVNEVHTWAGANTRIYLKSRDVLHSFFLPQMRLKQDAVPGKDYIPVWFKPTDFNGEWSSGSGWTYAKDAEGKDKVWELACAELCGWGHYKMNGKLYVHKDKDSYDRWLSDALQKQNAKDRSAPK